MEAQLRTQHAIHDAQPHAYFRDGTLWIEAKVGSTQLTLFMGFTAAVTLQEELIQAANDFEVFIKTAQTATAA